MGEPTEQQLAHVFGLLDQLQEGQFLEIRDHAPNKPKDFIECCKKYIDKGNFQYEFNTEYTRIRKIGFIY